MAVARVGCTEKDPAECDGRDQVNDWFSLAISRPEIELVGSSRPATIVDSVKLTGEIYSDPADRFLIATARARRAVLATHDEKIITYGNAGHVKVLAV
jgi:PIN domain nuclease of toxin-antitoxin system